MNNKAKALEFLINSIKGAFAKGFPAQIGTHEYYHLKRGQELTIGDDVFEALDEGIFQKAPVQQFDKEAGGYVTKGHTLLHYGHIGQLEDIVEHLCKDMTTHDIELAMVGITSRSVLGSMARRRGRESKEDSLSM